MKSRLARFFIKRTDFIDTILYKYTPNDFWHKFKYSISQNVFVCITTGWMSILYSKKYLFYPQSVHFYIDVNVTDEFQWGKEGHCSQHEEEYIASKYSVAEELHAL